jgi:hypothetical protein
MHVVFIFYSTALFSLVLILSNKQTNKRGSQRRVFCRSKIARRSLNLRDIGVISSAGRRHPQSEPKTRTLEVCLMIPCRETRSAPDCSGHLYGGPVNSMPHWRSRSMLLLAPHAKKLRTGSPVGVNPPTSGGLRQCTCVFLSYRWMLLHIDRTLRTASICHLTPARCYDDGPITSTDPSE